MNIENNRKIKEVCLQFQVCNANCIAESPVVMMKLQLFDLLYIYIYIYAIQKDGRFYFLRKNPFQLFFTPTKP